MSASIPQIASFARRPRWIPAVEICAELIRLGADDTGFAEELREALTETTDDLPR
ncbi:hypothetical protein AB0M50_20450 [Nonomuraea fuscirosea]|jgi:hypothetical protein|uniref:hypothetical protein n=1 Tax=Nonomuraea fuscirosea TaxID=1291556 RepID=UPI00341F448F